VIGTLDFMPPEQRQGAELTDHRSDLWSLSATFYQMITGKSPRVIRERDIPVSMRDLLMQALEEDPANRQSSALEFKKALLECRQTKTPEPLSGVVDEFSKNVPEGAHPTKGQSVEDKLEIPFATAVNGGEVSVNTVAGFTTPVMRVTIPAGIESGQKIRLKGKGYPGNNGGPNGDILLTIKVAPHPDYRRNGNDLELTMPLTLAEALQGTELDIPTPYSAITLKIPAGTPSGKRFRVKQHGVTHKTGKGNLFVITQIYLPDEPPAELVEQIAALQQANPRTQINW
jgi:curved DNA-binding protein CbpA